MNFEVTTAEMAALVQAAKEMAVHRWGDSGFAGAAAMLLNNGRTITSVCVETPNQAANLCHETGSICEAHKLNAKVVATACVGRERAGEDFIILSPCGICQERLAFWGADLRVAVAESSCSSAWQIRRLAELQPFYWAKVFGN